MEDRGRNSRTYNNRKKQVQDHPEDRLRRAETEGYPDRRLEEDRQVGEVLRTERA